MSKKRSFRFYKWAIVLFLFLLGMINFADKTIIGFAAVPMMKDLGLTHDQFGLVGSAFFWFFSVSAFVVGRLSDRFSAKTLLGSVASVWAFMQFATVFVVSLPQLVVTRVILGAAEGPSYNLSVHATAKWFAQSERGFAFSLVSIGSALGPAVAAPLLLHIIFNYGWRSAFVFLGLVGVLWIIVWVGVSRESPESAGLQPLESPRETPKVSIKWSRLAPVLLSRDFILVALAGFASYWGLVMLIVWVPAYLQEVLHLSHGQAQVVEGLPWLAGAVGSVSFTYASDWLFRRTQSSRKSRVYMLGVLGLLAALFWYLFVAVSTPGLAVVFLVVASALGSPGYPLSAAIVSDMVLPEHRGTMFGVLLGIVTSAGLIAPAVSGALIQSGAQGSGYYHAFVLMVIMNAVTTILFLIGVRPPPPGEVPAYARRDAETD